MSHAPRSRAPRLLPSDLPPEAQDAFPRDALGDDTAASDPLEAIAESLRHLDARLLALEDRRADAREGEATLNSRSSRSRRGPAPQETLPPALLLDVKSVAALLSCSWRSVYRLVEKRRFPAPIRVGALCRWSRSAIEAWLEERTSQRAR